MALRMDGAPLLKNGRKDLDTEEASADLRTSDPSRECVSRSRKFTPGTPDLPGASQNPVQTHIFLCVLAYHFLISIETSFLRKRTPHPSWATLRRRLSTPQVVTAVLPTPCGQLLRIRKGTDPEERRQVIYDTLGIPHEVMAPVKTWLPNPEWSAEDRTRGSLWLNTLCRKAWKLSA